MRNCLKTELKKANKLCAEVSETMNGNKGFLLISFGYPGICYSNWTLTDIGPDLCHELHSWGHEPRRLVFPIHCEFTVWIPKHPSPLSINIPMFSLLPFGDWEHLFLVLSGDKIQPIQKFSASKLEPDRYDKIQLVCINSFLHDSCVWSIKFSDNKNKNTKNPSVIFSHKVIIVTIYSEILHGLY